MNHRRFATCMLLAMTLTPRVSVAQDIGGSVLDAVTGAPVSGAVVNLLGLNRELLTRTITSAMGAFRVRHDSARILRVIRIGYSPYETRLPVAGPVSIKLTPLGRSLRPVSVIARPVCPSRADQKEALALWSSATDALLAMVVASEDSSQNGNVVQVLYNRVLDLRRGGVLRQSSQRVITSNATPIRADRDPEDFVEHGYVVRRGDVTTYHGPDAEVLLDSSFAATHCLSLRSGGGNRRGETGVAFTTPRGRDSIPDISGILWLSQNPLALRSLEFEYRNVHPAITSVAAGGRLDFATLTNGVPIIASWNVRSPRMYFRRARPAESGPMVYKGEVGRVGEIHETGGLIAQGQLADGTNWSTPLATLGGVVRTARTDELVAGAQVTLDSTDQQATTDSSGRFRFEQLLAGPHVIRARDSVTIRGVRADSLGNIDTTMVQQLVTRIATRRVDVRGGPNANVEVVLPWRESVSGCGMQEFERRFVVTGVVQQPDSSRVPQVAVRLAWADSSRGTTIETLVDAKADANGQFVMCGIPAERNLSTQVILPSGHGHFGITRISRLVRDGSGQLVPGSMRAITLTITP